MCLFLSIEKKKYIVTKILKYVRTNGCRKLRDGFKIEKFVVLAEYFEQQTDCSRYRRKISRSRKRPLYSWRNIHLSLLSKRKPCHGAINSWPLHIRTALKKYFQFHWNCEQLRVEARNSMSNCEIYFPIFSETIHTILKIFPQHGLRKCR